MDDNVCRECGSSSRYVVTSDGAMRCFNCDAIVDDGKSAVLGGAYAFTYPELPIVLVGQEQFKLARPKESGNQS